MTKQGMEDHNHIQKLQLHKELLDISKKQVQTAKVTVRKEVVTETKSIMVPIAREELVIEKRILGTDSSNPKAEHTETIRIPISEERIEIVKHPVALQDVSIYKNTFEELVHVEEILKKEMMHMETIGNPAVTEQKTDSNLRNL